MDRHCTRLDNDLQKIEDEQLIGSGRSTSVNTLTNKRSRDVNENQDTQPQKKQVGRKRTKKTQADNTITTQDDSYLSTQDAMQHAKV